MSAVSEHETGVASGVNNTVARLAGVLAVGALTAVAIACFSSSLEARLQEAGVPDSLGASLSAEAARLAELEAPVGVDASVTRAIQSAVASAYVTTFRVVVIICGVLAALSGLVAWFSLDRRPVRPVTRASPVR
jgi:hypothetical protein